jgi:hypothetical protein
MSGREGRDSYGFEQGDSPTLTLANLNDATSYVPAGATYTFAAGQAEVIEDFQPGDQIWLNPPFDGVTGAAWLSAKRDQSVSSGSSAGQVGDQGFMPLRGTLGNGGVFTVGSYDSGPDTLIVYDGDSSSGVSQTGFVLRGVSLNDLDYWSGNSIRFKTSVPVDPELPDAPTLRAEWEGISTVVNRGDDVLRFQVDASDG